jgi:hypothetical protein
MEKCEQEFIELMLLVPEYKANISKILNLAIPSIRKQYKTTITDNFLGVIWFFKIQKDGFFCSYLRNGDPEIFVPWNSDIFAQDVGSLAGVASMEEKLLEKFASSDILLDFYRNLI